MASSTLGRRRVIGVRSGRRRCRIIAFVGGALSVSSTRAERGDDLECDGHGKRDSADDSAVVVTGSSLAVRIRRARWHASSVCPLRLDASASVAISRYFGPGRTAPARRAGVRTEAATSTSDLLPERLERSFPCAIVHARMTGVGVDVSHVVSSIAGAPECEDGGEDRGEAEPEPNVSREDALAVERDRDGRCWPR